MKSPLDNAAIAEMLTREAEQAEGTLKRAFKRAARSALLWPDEAANLLEHKESLTVLAGIGPYLARRLEAWIADPPRELDPPPIRKGFLTLSKARKVLAQKPAWEKRYRGDLQMHSRWSDGAATIEEMATRAQALGYEYIAITDHSHGLKIAGGISEEDLLEQAAEIDQLNTGWKSRGQNFRVFHSLELNLNPRGEGDMSAASLERLDLVVGSFHSKLREKLDQTDRYLAALANPHVSIFGHPVGRIYNHRIGLSADWQRVCARATELGVALEIDSYPDRQDLNVELLKVAKHEGAWIAIDTDAHAPEQLAFVQLGLAAALLADIPAERIVNFMTAEQLLAWVKRGH